MSVVERSGTDGGSTELAITSCAAVTLLLRHSKTSPFRVYNM